MFNKPLCHCQQSGVFPVYVSLRDELTDWVRIMYSVQDAAMFKKMQPAVHLPIYFFIILVSV